MSSIVIHHFLSPSLTKDPVPTAPPLPAPNVQEQNGADGPASMGCMEFSKRVHNPPKFRELLIIFPYFHLFFLFNWPIDLVFGTNSGAHFWVAVAACLFRTAVAAMPWLPRCFILATPINHGGCMVN